MAQEIERKYIIKLPDIERLRLEKGFSESEIIQIYLDAPRGVTHRVRKRVRGGCAVYTETKKTRIDKMSVVEDEREISEEDYLRLSKNIKGGTTPVIKKRYTAGYNGKILEIDVYPNWKKTCIMEIELEDREEEISLPEYIELVMEVTGDFAYSNASMAKSFPLEMEKL